MSTRRPAAEWPRLVPLAAAPHVTGDPVTAAPEVRTPSEVLRVVGLPAGEAPAVARLGPGTALVRAFAPAPGPELSLRLVKLPHAPVLDAEQPRPSVAEPGHPPGPGPGDDAGDRIDLAFVTAAGHRDDARVLRLASRLRACFQVDGALRARLLATVRCEAAAAAIADAERTAGESVLPAADAFALLGGRAGGLRSDEAAARAAAVGPNRIERVRRRPLALRLLEQFYGTFALLLWVAGALAWLAGLPELGVAVFAVIVINGVFSFLQEYRAEHAVEALERLLPALIRVRRDGREVRLPTTELVPGDVVRVEQGDQVPADGQLLSASSLHVDQSQLTGESHAVSKATVEESPRVPWIERQALLFAGSGVAAGEGVLLVCATGMATEIGVIARLTQSVAETPSPLQREIGHVVRVVTVLAVALGVGFLAIGLAARAVPLDKGFVFALGVIVANVPEGLLPTLTLSLALGVQRMARQRSLVKRLSAVETLGATTVICTDKTGTLTENRMDLRRVWAGGRTRVVGAASADGDGLPGGDGAGEKERRPDGDSDGDVLGLLEAAVLASTATGEQGDPLEVAIVGAAERAGLDPDALRAPREPITRYAFDSFRKRMTIVRREGARAIAWVKGSPRELLALCTSVREAGRILPLDDERRRAILDEQDRLAEQGLRLLAAARRDWDEREGDAGVEDVERDLTFVGLLAFWDPPRPEVPGAVTTCLRAGIRVVMVTGDHGLTARSIARRIGLPVERVVSGEEVGAMPSAVLRHLLTQRGVLFARTSPAHKLAIVRALESLGEVVAVTGDGVNDAPALKAGDVGVAMGRRGTEVARQAADMVITDDNFASIVEAVRFGRATYANIGKFVTYIFASNVPELVPFLGYVFFGLPLPLTVMQVLAVDLGTDLLPALGLGAEPPEPGVMDRPPRRRDERLLGARRLLHAYAFLGLIEAALSMLAFFASYGLSGWRPGLEMAAGGEIYRRATTMSFAAIVAAQIGNVLACRTDRQSVFRVGVFRNRFVLLGIAAEIAILLALIETSMLRAIFGLAPLRSAEWGLLALLPIVVLLLEEARKWLLRLTAPPAPAATRPRPVRARPTSPQRAFSGSDACARSNE